MKYVDEYRDEEHARRLVDRVRRAAKRRWVVMEVCGGQTHSIVRHGIDTLLDGAVELVHGPGCPVCVTPLELIDKAQAIAAQGNVTLCSYGDMLRVPGTRGDLFSLRASGSDVRVVYSPLDAIAFAQKYPERQVVFFAIGFETTAPANAAALRVARERGVDNFSALVSHVLVPPAITAILSSRDNRVEGFLGPGHVCTVMGTEEYEILAKTHSVPIVIAGFEPVDLLAGILRTVEHLEAGTYGVDNAYARVVKPGGNAGCRELVEEVFETCDRKWRGIGTIPRSGLRLSKKYEALDAEARFDVAEIATEEPKSCISGTILRGLKKPVDCPAFGKECTPDHPFGATMVSAEGACAAYFAYGRHTDKRRLPVAEGTQP